jgi:hypothetical protein
MTLVDPQETESNVHAGSLLRSRLRNFFQAVKELELGRERY